MKKDDGVFLKIAKFLKVTKNFRKQGKRGNGMMKTRMEDIRNNADITPNWNDVRNTADITELSEMLCQRETKRMDEKTLKWVMCCL